jgi:hypothetical protein
MKTNYKIILYLLPIVLLFTTCRKNTTKPADQHFYYYLTKEQISKTPYFTNPAFDTLTYISNQNDTLIFAKTKTDTLWYISSVFDPGGTADKYYHYQQSRNSYATLKGEGKFEVLQSVSSSFPYIALSFNKFLIDFHEYTLSDPKYPTFMDSIQINNKSFYSLTRYHKINGARIDASFYVNKEFGLIYIIDNTNNTNWHLN